MCLLLLSCTEKKPPEESGTDPLVPYNVVWKTPSLDSSGSMPIGNGDIGLNVWVEGDGDLLFYIGKTDSWSENCRLLKLGRVRVNLTPNPFVKGNPFCQTLRLRTGEIEITAGPDDSAVKLRVWVDAHNPVIRVEAEGKKKFDVRVQLECWRKERRQLTGDELFSAYGITGGPQPVFVEPDSIMDGLSDRIVWYHRNERSCYEETLGLQHLGDLVERYPDPLLNRTFGGCMKGKGLTPVNDTTLSSSKPRKRFTCTIYTLTAQTGTIGEWLDRLNRAVAETDRKDLEKTRSSHRAWWNDFWNRSWIYASGSPDAKTVSQGYVLQNWINACGGRGDYPIKFNGSIFTVDAAIKDRRFDADYRSWGGSYWFQNTRLPYWSMPAAGNFDLMEPLFRMYLDTLPMARERTKAYYGHDGAYFPETMYFWGTYNNDNYGWERTDEPPGMTVNRYIRYEWQGGIELSAMMLDYYVMTQDERFLKDTLVPFANEILTFYDKHYPRDGNGRIRFEPAQALETYWDSVNPMPEIAGLQCVLNRLLELPESCTAESQRTLWRRIRDELPPIPTAEADGQTVLSPAQIMGPKNNRENPELYAVFPYGLYSVGKKDIDVALRTFERRVHKSTGGWQQDAIQAAMLGLTGEAVRMVTANFRAKNEGSRFPAFWGPNFDWLPDQTHGCVAMTALQRMLMQTDGRVIRLFPAWPRTWDVNFRLFAPFRTIVEGEVRNGSLVRLDVQPEARRADVEIMEMK
ncbi:DUF5703 domain-containing protein [bacterium]|nr:DUF5703 domain-containing protein [bacterium]